MPIGRCCIGSCREMADIGHDGEGYCMPHYESNVENLDEAVWRARWDGKTRMTLCPDCSKEAEFLTYWSDGLGNEGWDWICHPCEKDKGQGVFPGPRPDD